MRSQQDKAPIRAVSEAAQRATCQSNAGDSDVGAKSSGWTSQKYVLSVRRRKKSG